MIMALITSMIFAQSPAPLTSERLPFDHAKLGELAKVERTVDEGGRMVAYSGIPLASILEKTSKDLGTMAGLRNLSDAVLLVRGSDGYQAALSASAVGMDPKGERFLLATARDGRPLDGEQGPVRLIVPGDPKHVRWVRNVVSIRLVRLDKLVEP